MKALIKAISNKKVIVTIFLLFAVIASVQSYLQKKESFYQNGQTYPNYNNYLIFKSSFTHLIHQKDLYQEYPDEHWDFYKYSPTFSMFFGLFAIFPDIIGLNLWNIINALILLLAIYYLPRLNLKQKGLMLIICLLELTTSMQNQQSNGLIAGLIILTFGLLEKRHYLLATFCIVFSIYIKLFGVVGLALFLFYPQKWRLALYTLAWTMILFAFPLLVISFDQLKFLYVSWKHLIDTDLSASYGYSVIGWLHSWFGAGFNKIIVVTVGGLVFLLPFMRISYYKHFAFRLLALASLLLWIVIFNPKAESPTFIIAMAGVAIWFISGKKTILNIILFTAAFVLTSLSPTDLFPHYLRETFVKPYNLKVFPVIVIWLKIVYDMMVFRKNETIEEDAVQTKNA